MNTSSLRMRPGFWIVIGCVFVLFLLWSSFLPDRNYRTKAFIIRTHLEVKNVASVLQERAIQTGSLPAIDNHFLFQAIFGTNHLDYYAERTNALGEVLDCWKTPFRIEILDQTNFIVRSAGPNHKAGDGDDIVFNSISNDFVSP